MSNGPPRRSNICTFCWRGNHFLVIRCPGTPASMPSDLTPSPGANAVLAIWPELDLWDHLWAFPNWHIVQTGSGSFAKSLSQGSKPHLIQLLICSQWAWAPRSCGCSFFHWWIVRLGYCGLMGMGLSWVDCWLMSPLWAQKHRKLSIPGAVKQRGKLEMESYFMVVGWPLMNRMEDGDFQ